MLHSGIVASPGHCVVAVVPGVVDVYRARARGISKADHCVPGYLDQDRPSRVYFVLKIGEREALCVVLVTHDVLRVVAGHTIAT